MAYAAGNRATTHIHDHRLLDIVHPPYVSCPQVVLPDAHSYCWWLQVSDEAATADAAAPGASGDSFVGSLEDAVLHNANQFHKWHTELEAACASETEEKYKQYAQLLQGHLASCDKLQGQVGALVAGASRGGGGLHQVWGGGWAACAV